MKRLRFFILMLTLLFCGLQPTFAGDSTNVLVRVFETFGSVIYYNTTGFSSTTLTDDLRTKAMYIGDRDRSEPIMIEIYGNAAASIDVNAFAWGSLSVPASGDSLSTGDFLVGTTNSDLDALGAATVLIDTLEVVGAVTDDHVDNADWIYLEFDGQSGNPATATITWRISVQKKEKGNEAAFRGADNQLVRPVCTVCP